MKTTRRRALLPLEEQLQKLLMNAKRIRDEGFQQYEKALAQNQLRLRPSVQSISLVSYSATTPQLGYSSLRSPEALGKKLEILSLAPLAPPRRQTPEKRLQSWLIQEAYENGGLLKSLDVALGSKHRLVTDEIALEDPSNGKKIVADLLLVSVGQDHQAQLVNVELKSRRAMETFDQVINFRRVLENPTLQPLWKEFVECMAGQFRWQQSEKTRGLVVWPRTNNFKTARAIEKAKRYEHVDVLGYSGNYILEYEGWTTEAPKLGTARSAQTI